MKFLLFICVSIVFIGLTTTSTKDPEGDSLPKVTNVITDVHDNDKFDTDEHGESVSGPVALDLTVLPRLVKEAYGGITRFYVNILYILLQYLREISTNATAQSVDEAKTTAERILRGGVDYQEELSRMSHLLGDIQRRAAPTMQPDTEYSTTQGVPPGEEIVPPISEQIPISKLIRNFWSRLTNWSRRLIGLNNTRQCCEPEKIINNNSL